MCSRLLKLIFARFFCPENFLDALFIILRSNEVPYPAPLGVFLFFTWASSHHAAVPGDCLSIIVTSSANVREVQQTEANFLERLLPKMRCSKCIPRAAYSCFLETGLKNVIYDYATPQPTKYHFSTRRSTMQKIQR